MASGGLEHWQEQPAIVSLVFGAAALVVYVAGSILFFGDVRPLETILFVVVFTVVSYVIRQRREA
ncbi:MAG: hypothetical protein ABEH35_05960 [Haloarculaceae archaeon]